MGNDQKDRFGDKLRDLEHAREDQYFAEREKGLLEKMREKKPSEERDEPPKDEGGKQASKDG